MKQDIPLRLMLDGLKHVNFDSVEAGYARSFRDLKLGENEHLDEVIRAGRDWLGKGQEHDPELDRSILALALQNVFHVAKQTNPPAGTAQKGIVNSFGASFYYTNYGDRIEIDRIDLPIAKSVSKRGLNNSLARQLRERLHSRGVSHEDANRIARAAGDFSGASGLGEAERAIAVDLAVAAVLADRQLRQGQSGRAPALWIDRDKSEFPTAESFLRTHYGPRLGMDGDLTLADVGRYDTPLLTALNREFKGRREALHLLLPTATQRADQRLLKKHGYIPKGKDRVSKLSMLSHEQRARPI